jgi:hypothetical protein
MLYCTSGLSWEVFQGVIAVVLEKYDSEEGGDDSREVSVDRSVICLAT